MLNLHRFRPSRAGVSFRFDTIEIPTPGRSGHLFPPSAPPAEDDVRGSLTPRSRRPDIHLRVVLSHFYAASPRSYLHTPHYNGGVLVKP